MTHKILVILSVLVAAIYADHQTYPGTSNRPVLSDSEASSYTVSAYLQGWSPPTIKTDSADYTVGSDGLPTIQAAVNAAIQDGGSKRKYIKIPKGTYNEAVIIPKTSVPITIYGTPGSPRDVVIRISQGALMTGSDYAKQVNPGGSRYQEGDPAWSMFDRCASRPTIGTSCSAVFWAANEDLEVAYLTIDNPETNGQAVAARIARGNQNWDNVHLYGFQDTLLVAGEGVYFHKATIKGDVDFIFGAGAAVFDSAEIIARADRPRNSSVVFAPSTDGDQPYGYLVINSHITAESGIASAKGCSLARAWDPSSHPNANGQLVIRETRIDDVINADAPYQTATSGRAYSGNIDSNRNLDDKKFNRFWEYKNTGGGA